MTQATAPVADYEQKLDVFNKRERNGQPLWSLRSSGRVAGQRKACRGAIG